MSDYVEVYSCQGVFGVSRDEQIARDFCTHLGEQQDLAELASRAASKAVLIPVVVDDILNLPPSD
jgi:hypothetical protein